MCIVGKNAAASHAGWNLGEIDLVCEWDQARTSVDRLSSEVMAVCNQDFGQDTVQSELCDAQSASFRFDSWWRSASDHAKTSDQHLTL